MKRKKLEKKLEENLSVILMAGEDTNNLWEAYKKKASKKEMKKFRKRIRKSFEKKFDEVFIDGDAFDV